MIVKITQSFNTLNYLDNSYPLLNNNRFNHFRRLNRSLLDSHNFLLQMTSRLLQWRHPITKTEPLRLSNFLLGNLIHEVIFPASRQITATITTTRRNTLCPRRQNHRNVRHTETSLNQLILRYNLILANERENLIVRTPLTIRILVLTSHDSNPPFSLCFELYCCFSQSVVYTTLSQPLPILYHIYSLFASTFLFFFKLSFRHSQTVFRNSISIIKVPSPIVNNTLTQPQPNVKHFLQLFSKNIFPHIPCIP